MEYEQSLESREQDASQNPEGRLKMAVQSAIKAMSGAKAIGIEPAIIAEQLGVMRKCVSKADEAARIERDREWWWRNHPKGNYI